MRMSGPSPAYKRQKTTHTDHVKLARLQRQVAALRPEVKLFETGTFVPGAAPVPTAGVISPLTLIAQGTNAENRIGDICRAVSLEVKILPSTNSTIVAASVASYSFLIVKDLESNGVLPTISGANGIFVSNTPVGCIQQAETSKRFKILAQRTFTLTEINLSRNVFIRWFLKFNHQMTFHDATATQTACGKNAMYIVMLTDDPGINASHASYNVSAVLRFTDS